MEKTVTWKEDVLGDGFVQATLELTPDSEGPVVATIVKAPAPQQPGFLDRLLGRSAQVAANTDVLYIHGWSD